VLDAVPPYAFALVSAFLFALGDQVQAQGLPAMSARTGAALGIAASAVSFWLLAPWFLQIENFWHHGVLWFIAIGFIRPALSANLAIAGIRHLGPTLAGTLSSIAPLFGAAFGILLLGEVLTWPVAAGTAGITAAVAILAQSGRRTATGWPAWAILLPIGAALVRSTSHAVTKIGMLEIPDPYFAALVAFSVSAVLTISLETLPRRNRQGRPLSVRAPGAAWFIASGVIFAVSVLCLNRALIEGEIITVVPIIAAAPVFTMAMSVTIFKREMIMPRTLLALALVLPSVIAIVVLG